MGFMRIAVAIVFLGACKGGESALANEEVVASSPEDAKALAEQAKKMQGVIEELWKLVDDVNGRDATRDKQLAAVRDKLEVRSYRIGRVRDEDAVARLVELYAAAAEILSLIDVHVRQAKLDAFAFERGAKAAAAAKVDEASNAYLAGSSRFAIVVSALSDKDPSVPFGARLVELGPPACAGKIARSGKCPDDEPATGIAYRAAAGAPWQIGEIVMGGADEIPAKRIVPLVPTQVFDALVQGADVTVAEVAYK